MDFNRRRSQRSAVAIAARKSGNARDEVLQHILRFFPEPYAMLSAFQDESGTHEGSAAMVVSSVLFDGDSLEIFNKLWAEALDAGGIKHFHKADSAGLRGEFTDKLYRKLIPIIRQCALGSVTACSIRIQDFDTARAGGWKYSPYTICSVACMILLGKLAESLGHDQVSFFIESGHEKAGELMKAIERLRADDGWPGVATCGFYGKSDFHHLSAADLIAYETAKRLKAGPPDESGHEMYPVAPDGISPSPWRTHGVIYAISGILSSGQRSRFLLKTNEDSE